MAPLTNSSLLSPAELSYLHQSLTYDPPVRPDNRKATQFRSVTAELDFLPSTYGSARVQLEDGTAAIVGIKADVEKTRDRIQSTRVFHEEEDSKVKAAIVSQDDWIEVNVNIPDSRDDDTLPIYLGQLILESLQSSGHLPSRCRINSRFHWKLYIDVLLLSTPLSYPLPLLSLATHLALLSTRLPALVSKGEEDVLCNDDWEASTYIYSKDANSSARPPISLLVITVRDNLIFDPRETEIAVADSIVAVTVVRDSTSKRLRVISIRTMDPPARHTMTGPIEASNVDPEGLPSVGRSAASPIKGSIPRGDPYAGLESPWRPPMGGISRDFVRRIVKRCTEESGVGSELLDGLEAYLQQA